MDFDTLAHAAWADAVLGGGVVAAVIGHVSFGTPYPCQELTEFQDPQSTSALAGLAGYGLRGTDLMRGTDLKRAKALIDTCH